MSPGGAWFAAYLGTKATPEPCRRTGPHMRLRTWPCRSRKVMAPSVRWLVAHMTACASSRCCCLLLHRTWTHIHHTTSVPWLSGSLLCAICGPGRQHRRCCSNRPWHSCPSGSTTRPWATGLKPHHATCHLQQRCREAARSYTQVAKATRCSPARGPPVVHARRGPPRKIVQTDRLILPKARALTADKEKAGQGG